MTASLPELPPSPSRRRVLEILGRYWEGRAEALDVLPLVETDVAERVEVPPRLEAVTLPAWAADLGPGGSLLVPARAIGSGDLEPWERTDWLGAAEWFVTCAAEREFERLHGPIHSYSFRLKGWDPRIWERAWANRIALFLRRWSARTLNRDEVEVFGRLPDADIIVTHDVDAVAKPISLRIKQGSFHLFNAGRRLAHGDVSAALSKSRAAVRFVARREDLWNFERITDVEDRAGIRSHFNFYAGRTGWRRGWRSLLIDPAYDVGQQRLQRELRRLRDGGWTIGLHQSFGAWRDADQMRAERVALEAAADAPVTVCRQHWLRFSFAETWSAQKSAGLALDTTLGFNDRPGFRAGAALRMHPFGQASFAALPMVLMDSHVYDYEELTPDARREAIAHWVGEVLDVRGTATVIWHQQVFGDAYGWYDGFLDLMRAISDDR